MQSDSQRRGVTTRVLTIEFFTLYSCEQSSSFSEDSDPGLIIILAKLPAARENGVGIQVLALPCFWTCLILMSRLGKVLVGTLNEYLVF